MLLSVKSFRSLVSPHCGSIRFITCKVGEYYSLLGVEKHATSEQIKVAFQKKVKALHPDLNGGRLDVDEFCLLMTAYDTLISADKRQEYDLASDKSNPEILRKAATKRFNQGRNECAEELHPDTQSLQWRYGWDSWGQQGPNQPAIHMHGNGIGTVLHKYRHDLEANLHTALLHAYFGPRVAVQPGELPECFELEERSNPGISGDLVQVVSGRTLLGLVQEASQQLLGGEQNANRRTLEGCTDKLFLSGAGRLALDGLSRSQPSISQSNSLRSRATSSQAYSITGNPNARKLSLKPEPQPFGAQRLRDVWAASQGNGATSKDPYTFIDTRPGSMPQPLAEQHAPGSINHDKARHGDQDAMVRASRGAAGNVDSNKARHPNHDGAAPANHVKAMYVDSIEAVHADYDKSQNNSCSNANSLSSNTVPNLNDAAPAPPESPSTNAMFMPPHPPTTSASPSASEPTFPFPDPVGPSSSRLHYSPWAPDPTLTSPAPSRCAGSPLSTGSDPYPNQESSNLLCHHEPSQTSGDHEPSQTSGHHESQGLDLENLVQYLPNTTFIAQSGSAAETQHTTLHCNHNLSISQATNTGHGFPSSQQNIAGHEHNSSHTSSSSIEANRSCTLNSSHEPTSSHKHNGSHGHNSSHVSNSSHGASSSHAQSKSHVTSSTNETSSSHAQNSSHKHSSSNATATGHQGNFCTDANARHESSSHPQSNITRRLNSSHENNTQHEPECCHSITTRQEFNSSPHGNTWLESNSSQSSDKPHACIPSRWDDTRYKPNESHALNHSHAPYSSCELNSRHDREPNHEVNTTGRESNGCHLTSSNDHNVSHHCSSTIHASVPPTSHDHTFNNNITNAGHLAFNHVPKDSHNLNDPHNANGSHNAKDAAHDCTHNNDSNTDHGFNASMASALAEGALEGLSDAVKAFLGLPHSQTGNAEDKEEKKTPEEQGSGSSIHSHTQGHPRQQPRGVQEALADAASQSSGIRALELRLAGGSGPVARAVRAEDLPHKPVKIVMGGRVVVCRYRNTLLDECGMPVATLSQFHTPGVHHIHVYRRSRPARRLLCRATRAWLPPSNTWLFAPRSTAHDIGGWYVEWEGHKRQHLPGWLHPAALVLILSFEALDREQKMLHDRSCNQAFAPPWLQQHKGATEGSVWNRARAWMQGLLRPQASVH